MNRYDDRYKGATGIVLNVPEGFMDAVLVTTKDGRQAVVNSEGVGEFVQDDNTVTMYTHMSWTDVPLEEVKAMATEEEVDLADFIRIFGDRLDRNHSIWYHLIRG